MLEQITGPVLQIILFLSLSLSLSPAVDTPAGDCSTGDLRLGNYIEYMGSLTRAGLLEVCINNAWGTVCETSFDVPDVMVACYQLEGFSSTGPSNIFYNAL